MNTRFSIGDKVKVITEGGTTEEVFEVRGITAMGNGPPTYLIRGGQQIYFLPENDLVEADNE